VRPLAIFGPDYLLTRHRDRLVILYTAVNLLALGALGLFLTNTGLGPLGMAVAGYFPLGIVLLIWGIHRLDPRGLRRLSANLGELYGVGALIFAPILLISADRPWWRLVLSGLAALLVLSYCLWRFGDAYLSFLRLTKPDWVPWRRRKGSAREP